MAQYLVVTKTRFQCDKCEHNWYPRRSEKVICPKCKSEKWDEDEHVEYVSE